jgi:hypothetical protein
LSTRDRGYAVSCPAEDKNVIIDLLMVNEQEILGKQDEEKLNHILHEASKIKKAGERIGFISRHFLNTPYKESTLIGDVNTSEVFVINLEGVDCLTFIEYIEAMRLSGSFTEFKDNLKMVRYKDRVISFTNRNHFFTDWPGCNADLVTDVTEKVGKAIETTKTLNLKEDGAHLLKGIKPVKRIIKYIPKDNFNDSLYKGLKTGDYIGIYSPLKWLDVSHVGIIIREESTIYLRHASSKKAMVVDDEFREYISDKAGLIVLRPRDTT